MRKKGFSLIELMVVLILMSISIALVTPSLSRFSRTMELKGAAKKVSDILRYCRSEAVNKGQVYQALFDPNLREVRVQSMQLKGEKDEKQERRRTPKTYSLPEGVWMKNVDMASPQHPSNLHLFEFYPNGGSNGGEILLDRKDNKGYKIKVDFLTGMVKIGRAEGVGR